MHDDSDGVATDSTPTGGDRTGAGVVVLVALLLAVYHAVVRPRHRHWGATDDEVSRRLPGDDVLAEPSDETTRAVTIGASPDEVWAWVVQLGQGRGGFYSYTWLENLVGADIHNADRVDPALQELRAGDSIRMVRADYWLQSPATSMTVERVDPGRTLVLRGHDGGTWTFHLDRIDDGTTRLLVRGRKPVARTAVGYLVRYVGYELPHFVMERGMMRGIQARAERAGRTNR